MCLLPLSIRAVAILFKNIVLNVECPEVMHTHTLTHTCVHIHIRCDFKHQCDFFLFFLFLHGEILMDILWPPGFLRGSKGSAELLLVKTPRVSYSTSVCRYNLHRFETPRNFNATFVNRIATARIDKFYFNKSLI